MSFNFAGDPRDDANTGISPINVIDGSESHRKHNLELSKLQGTVFQNEVGFTLSDLDTLQKRELQAVPICYFDLEKSLRLLGNLLGVVLGNTHIFMTYYRHFWDVLSLTFRDEICDQINVQSTLRPAHLIRNVQLIVHTWFTTRKLNGAPPPLHQILLTSYQVCNCPPTSYQGYPAYTIN
jgi:hypothetical protein